MTLDPVAIARERRASLSRRRFLRGVGRVEGVRRGLQRVEELRVEVERLEILRRLEAEGFYDQRLTVSR